MLRKRDEVPPLTLGRTRTTGLDDVAGHASPGATDAGDLCLNAEAFVSRAGAGVSMSEISRSALFGKLNSLAYKAIEGATVFCKLRGNPYVELVHWMQQILQTPDSDLHRIVRHFELDASRLAKDITEALDRLPRGATSISGPVVARRERGRARLGLRHADVRRLAGAHRPPRWSACSRRPSLRNALIGDLAAVRAIKLDTLTDDFARDRQAGRPRTRWRRATGSSLAAPGEASGAMAPAQMGKQEALKRFATDLTERARKGEIDPVTGRDEEIRQIVDILMRRRQNNPILTGEAGVGKTAVVEGFRAAHRAGRRAAAAQGRVAAHARHRPAAGRRQHEGRVREPAAPGDRRGAGVAEADHPVHRRGAHADRRRRRGRHRRRRQPAQAGAGARHAAHDRRHDLGGIQEAHREGSGADAPLPGRAGRRARARTRRS